MAWPGCDLLGWPGLTLEGQLAMGADAVDPLEQQRRELEELRRSFQEQGTPADSLFEPTALDEPEEPQQPRKAQEAGPKKPVVTPGLANLPIATWALPVVVSLLWLLAGTGLGYLLHRPAAVGVQSTASTVVAHTAPETKPVPPPACLETARRADQTIDLLLRNVRDRRLSLAFKAYTEASQACRTGESP